MVDYIKQIAQDLIYQRGDMYSRLEALRDELNRLDPRDFLPAAQANFVKLRLAIVNGAEKKRDGSGYYNPVSSVTARQLATHICDVLDLYGGEGSRAESRTFKFVKNSGLRTIIERDYRELSLKLLPAGAWKSTVVMAGSILEAILYDLLSDPANKAKALGASAAPKKLDLGKGEWKLHNLIQVATELKLLPDQRTDAIDTILPDYRNFVHPMLEVRDAHPCAEAEALMAKGALDSVCNHLGT